MVDKNDLGLKLLWVAGCSTDSLVSPYSLEQLLGMLLNGVPQNTDEHDALCKLLGVEDANDFNRNRAGILDTPENEEEGYRPSPVSLKLANAIWCNSGTMRDSEDVLQKFKGGDIPTYFGAHCGSVPQESVDDWVCQATKGKISEMSLPTDFDVALMNTLYMKGSWKNSFEDGDGKFLFHGRDCDIAVPYMCGTAELLYAESDDYVMVALPYHGLSHEMIVVMAKNDTVAPLVSEQDYNNLYAQLRKGEVYLRMPKFEITGGMESGNVDAFLKSRGVDLFNKPILFDMNLAVSSISQKAAITVNEAGTEAAACSVATLMRGMSFNILEAAIKIDRPFMFRISAIDSFAQSQSARVYFCGWKCDF